MHIQIVGLEIMGRKTNLPKPSGNLYSGYLPEGYISALRSGSDLIKSGDYSTAESYLTKMAFKYHDGNLLFVLFLADALFLQGRLEEAEKLYRDLIEITVFYEHPHHGLALILLKTNRASEAEQHIRMAKPKMGGEIPEYLPPLK